MEPISVYDFSDGERENMSHGLYRGISHKKEIILAFFLGGSVSAIAFDLSDLVFYNASSSGALNAQQQAGLYSVFPFIYYLGFFGLGYLLFRFTHVGPTFILALYGVTIVIAFILLQGLPQTSDVYFVAVAYAGTAISLGIIYGLYRQVR